MAKFFSLTVKRIQKTTKDAVIVTLLTPKSTDFSFVQGQYLTFRRKFNGKEIRRSYSICSGINEHLLQVGIKHVPGGIFSSWANTKLQPGDTLESLTPKGNFFTDLDPNVKKHYLGFAGGSGITPILSLIKSTLFIETKSFFTLVYANRRLNTIMFREELEDLKNIYMNRLNIVHIIEEDPQEIELFSGRIDYTKIVDLFKFWLPKEKINTFFICGPNGMRTAITNSLSNLKIVKSRVKYELFNSPKQGYYSENKPSQNKSIINKKTFLDVTLDGSTTTISMNRDQSILKAALENFLDAPHSCQAGVCSTCKCKILEGQVEMLNNHALEDYEVEAGYVLSCQAYPVGERIKITYDH